MITRYRVKPSTTIRRAVNFIRRHVVLCHRGGPLAEILVASVSIGRHDGAIDNGWWQSMHKDDEDIL